MPMPSYKEIVDLIKKGADLEAQEKIMELREDALAFQEENLELRRQIADMEKHIGELEEDLSLQKDVKFEGGVYWHMDGDQKEGPFCQRCLDVDNKMVRLQALTVSSEHQWRCYECKRAYMRTRV